jgi:hypothetical protein
VRERLTEGSGRVTTRVAPAPACTYLAHPRHAGEWFAAVTVHGPDGETARQGQHWRFVAHGGGTGQPVELTRLDCPHGFAWQTRLSWPRTNIRWELQVTSEPGGGSTLILTTRWLPGLLGWPLVVLLVLARRGALNRRSQRTVERARDALEAAVPAGVWPTRGSPSTTRPTARRRRRR